MVGSEYLHEEGIAMRFWSKLRDESVFAIYSPFVVCLASGNLESQTFLHFVGQDVHFLKAFAQAYELAEDCADDDEDKVAIRKLRKSVLEKLRTHDVVVGEWGFELPDKSGSDKATIKYTEFLLATASGKMEGEKFPGRTATPFEKTKVAAYTLAAMAPCMRLNAYISGEIHALIKSDENSHIYERWVDTYSSQKYEASAQETEDLLDKLSVSLTGEELVLLEKLYHQAIRLEVEFFFAQPVPQQTIVPLFQVSDSSRLGLTIFCDFDLTCTIIDSSAILAEIAILTAPKTDQSGTETPTLTRMLSADIRYIWGVLSCQYAEGFEKCLESIISSNKGEGFNYEGLSNALERVSEFEKAANSRVVESGVLKGLHLEDIKRAGQSQLLQDGCRGFFEKLVKREEMKTDVHVLSSSWCGDLIRSAFSSGDLNALEVQSNDLAYNESITTGEIIKKMESPREKLLAFNTILNNSRTECNHLTAYIGRSVGDLLCLLEADVGVVINPSPSLRRVGDHFGVSFVPLYSGLVKKQREIKQGITSNWEKMSGVLYTVSSWAEIHAFILGSQ